MYLFYHKTRLANLQPTAKVMENQNFNFDYLRTMIFCLQTYYKKIRQKGWYNSHLISQLKMLDYYLIVSYLYMIKCKFYPSRLMYLRVAALRPII